MERQVFFRFAVVLFITIFFAFFGFASQEGKRDQAQFEEMEDYYKKWLNEDVIYIISDEEKAVFSSLNTPEEKEQFIEQFWFRRDQTPTTAINEFKEEHYRRIAYANDRFGSGFRGWLTDRGRVYIIHGQPDSIETHPSGGNYNRPVSEGGGSTTTYPFEIWRYRNIEGIGNDVVLEFVDSTLTGEYKLALNPEEKDALLYTPGGGKTLAEQMGLATKGDRPWFSGKRPEEYPMMYSSAKDNPFTRYETYAMVQAATPVKYRDLKQLVEVDVEFASIPFVTRKDYFRLNDGQFLTSISIQVDNKDLTFKPEGDQHLARLAVYGVVTSITNRLAQEFDDDVISAYSPDSLMAGLQRKSIYQKVLVLDRRMRYKLSLVIKDLNSNKVGVHQTGIEPPRYDEGTLAGSSLILSDAIQVLDLAPSTDEMFVVGDVKVRPNLEKSFSSAESLGVYYQVYNAAIDQTTLQPSLRVVFQILKDGLVVREVVDEDGESVQFFSGQRVVLVKSLGLGELEQGRYGIRLDIEDRLTGQKLSVDDRFRIVETPQHVRVG